MVGSEFLVKDLYTKDELMELVWCYRLLLISLLQEPQYLDEFFTRGDLRLIQRNVRTALR